MGNDSFTRAYRGQNFKFGGKTGNTRDSHRLIQLAKTKSPQLQTRVVEELFAAYFENEQVIGFPRPATVISL